MKKFLVAVVLTVLLAVGANTSNVNAEVPPGGMFNVTPDSTVVPPGGMF